LNKIATGDDIEFRVNGLGNEIYTGKVVSLGQVVDNMNRSLEIYARATDNNPQFRPGMYVNAQVK
jgi:cobalt-zinc-cadmium efflux system membrane fusion protein